MFDIDDRIARQTSRSATAADRAAGELLNASQSKCCAFDFNYKLDEGPQGVEGFVGSTAVPVRLLLVDESF